MSGEIEKKYVFKNRIAEYREKLHVSQSELAKRVNVSRQTISAVERGVYVPTAYVAALIAQELDVPFEVLFYTELLDPHE